MGSLSSIRGTRECQTKTIKIRQEANQALKVRQATPLAAHPRPQDALCRIRVRPVRRSKIQELRGRKKMLPATRRNGRVKAKAARTSPCGIHQAKILATRRTVTRVRAEISDLCEETAKTDAAFFIQLMV